MIVKKSLRYLLSLLLFGMLSLNGFELPQILPEGAAPEIIDFVLYRPADSTEQEYALVWDTKNAAKVIISTIGEVELSGKHIVKDSDQSIDEIILTAYGAKGLAPVTKTVYVKEQTSLGLTYSPEDDRMNESIPMSPVRQRMLAPRRPFRYY